MKRTVEAELVQVPENFKKRFLIDIPGFIRGVKQVHRDAKYTLVVRAHEALERVRIAPLGCPDQAGFVQPGFFQWRRQYGTHRSCGIVHFRS
jgi:hypothetical protein